MADHPGALAYDWRARFGLPVSAVFDGRMSIDEAWLLAEQLLADPTSQIRAAKAEWEYPFSHEARILADLFDVTLAANVDQKKRAAARKGQQPRPWPDRTVTSSTTPSVDQATVLASLQARAPRREDP